MFRKNIRILMRWLQCDFTKMIVFTVLCESDKNITICTKLTLLSGPAKTEIPCLVTVHISSRIWWFLSLSQSTVKTIFFVKSHWSQRISILIFLRNTNHSSKKGHRKPGFDDILRKTQGTDDGQNHRSENVINEGIWTPNGPLFGGFWTPFPE